MSLKTYDNFNYMTDPILDELVKSGHLKEYKMGCPTNDKMPSWSACLVFPDGKYLTMLLPQPRCLPSWGVGQEKPEELEIEIDESDFIE